MGALRVGEVVAGKFQIERVLGQGGMGYVVAARHLQLGQTVALKFIREDVLTSEYKSRFLREARNTVRLKSKHVSRVLDVGTLDSGAPYMVMEYLEGTDLSAMLQARGAIPASEACDYVIQACEAIAEAHANHIVHRDLKPANLFLARGVGGEPVLKVLDFGVSKVVELASDETMPGGRAFQDSVVTRATDLLGSPSYMAPEQVISARDADARSDVWSLGVILFRMLAGAPPFAGVGLGDLIQQIVRGATPNLRQLRPELPPGIEGVVARCLERDRDRRPTAVELARLLAPYAGPNARPSLERIAILGPTLAPPAPPSSPSLVPAAVGSRSSPGSSRGVPPPRAESSAIGTLFWALLLAVVVGSLVIIALRVHATRRSREAHASAPPPTTVPAASESAAPEPAPSLAPAPREVEAAPASARPAPSARPRAGQGRSRAPSPDIPSSRD
jgi:serine/threonine-protein kinase